ncbi:hypothetical protein AA464_23740 [Salmonella enterica subsp. enterica serovar Newport]|nr:hypothetical protein [Salmonella enterica subsp. enterica serovar Newport]
MSTMSSKALDRLNCWRYAYPAPHKTGAGRCNPKIFKATPDAASVFFCVRHMCHSMAWCVLLNPVSIRIARMSTAHHAAHNGAICGCCVRLRPAIDAQNRISRRQRMVTLAGQPKGWPVSLKAGIATPVNVTAPIERCNSSGDSLNIFKEAVYHGYYPYPVTSAFRLALLFWPELNLFNHHSHQRTGGTLTASRRSPGIRCPYPSGGYESCLNTLTI